MAEVTKTNLDTLFQNIETFEESKKEATDNVKDAFESFATQYGEDKDKKSYIASLKDAYKKYKLLKKDRAKFVIIESETDQIIEKLMEEE